ncbi:MAG: hypothetical protein ACLGIN_10535 [Candidatus Sericytochromatia bacterium]
MDTFVNQSPELTAAIKRYLKSQQQPTTVSVAVEKAAPGFVRARVTLETAEADPAFVFLKEHDGDYQVLGMGTFFEPSFYQQEGIPAALKI